MSSGLTRVWKKEFVMSSLEQEGALTEKCAGNLDLGGAHHGGTVALGRLEVLRLVEVIPPSSLNTEGLGEAGVSGLLGACGLWVGHGQGGKGGEAVRVVGDGGSELVVGLGHQVRLVEAQRVGGVRDDLLADVVGRHVLFAVRSESLEFDVRGVKCID